MRYFQNEQGNDDEDEDVTNLMSALEKKWTRLSLFLMIR